MILALDTTSEFGSIALADERGTIEEILLHSPDGFAHILIQRIQELLARHNLVLPQIDCFAAAAGPGSFTGVRIGLAAVKGFAEATGRRVAAVSNLQALAFFGSARWRATVLDARRGEIYGAVFDHQLQVVAPETVMKFPAWLETLPANGYEFIATDFSPFRAQVDPGIPVVTAPRALAGAIAHIAAFQRKQGRSLDPAAIDANYVRRSDAELFWKE